MRGLIEHRADIAEVLAEAMKKDPEAVPILQSYYAALIRDDFWQFRRYIHPHLIEGWWIKETAYELQDSL